MNQLPEATTPEATTPPAKPLLSLALIVRNEAATLPALLEGHRGLWDEAVVVDTGSTDGSAELAAALGARVAAFAWTDDFAAARNAALALCEARWVLVLDADEHIAADDHLRLRELLAAAEPGAFLLPQWNYVDDASLPDWRPVTPDGRADARGAGGYVLAYQVRVFPGGLGVAYQGRIHETVEPSLAALGLELRLADIPIHHHGHRAGAQVMVQRQVRNGRLLRLKLADEPGDPRARYELAAHLAAQGSPDLARRLLERLLAEAPGGPRTVDAWRLLGRLAVREGRLQDAVAACRAAVLARPDLADGWPDLVRALWQAGDRPAAGVTLERFAALFPADPRVAALRAQVQAAPADNN